MTRNLSGPVQEGHYCVEVSVAMYMGVILYTIVFGKEEQ